MLKRFIAILAVLIPAAIAYVIFSGTDDAKDRTAAAISLEICNAIKPGMPLRQVAELVSSKRGWYHPLAPNVAQVGAKGWYSTCRCTVTFKEGVVDSVSQRVCIN